MKIELSDIKARVVLGILFLVFLIGQSYILITKSFQSMLTPLLEFPELHSFIEGVLWEIWLEMLIWPGLLFTVLLAEIVALWRKKAHSA